MGKDCANCEHFGTSCTKNMLRLPYPDLVRWCVVVKGRLNLTKEELSGLSGVPKGTIDRVLANTSSDCRYSTMQAIVAALVGRLKPGDDCSDLLRTVEAGRDEALERENVELRKALEALEQEKSITMKHFDEVGADRDFVRTQSEVKDVHMKNMMNTIWYLRRAFRVVAVLLAISVSAVVISLIMRIL